MTKDKSQKGISIVIILSAIVATLSLTTGLTNQTFAQESSNLVVHIKKWQRRKY